MDNAEFDILVRLVEDNVVDVADLVAILEITIEEVVDRFPDKLKENAEKFGYYPNYTEEEVQVIDEVIDDNEDVFKE